MSQALDYWHEVFLTLFSSGKNCIFQIFVLRTQFSLSFSSILVSCKGLYRQSYGFSSSHVWMWELNHKEGWVLKNWCFWTVVLEKTFFFLSLVFFSRIQEAWGWCTGMTQKDGMGREVGGGFRIGNTCTPVVDSCWCMAKPIQCCKVISL